MTTAAKIKSMLLIALVALILVGISTTKHAIGRTHQGTLLTSSQIQDIIEAELDSINHGWQGPCHELRVYVCPFCKIVDKSSPDFGKTKSRVKAACRQKDQTMWLVGIISFDNAFITGYAMTTADLERTAARDNCFMGNVTMLQRLWFKNIPPPTHQ